MATLEKVSTLKDMKILMDELHRLEVKFLCEFYGVLQDFSSKRLLPQWFQKKNIKNPFIADKGSDILAKVKNSKKLAIIIYDLETPDLNGLQFLTEQGNNPDLKSRCKVILAMPKLSIDVQNKLSHMGAAALVPKPLTEEDLQKAFEKLGLDY
jgi:DNA-binding NtrC family response regulator